MNLSFFVLLDKEVNKGFHYTYTFPSQLGTPAAIDNRFSLILNE